MATTELHKIPDTILSRCQRFDFSKLSTNLIIEKLSRIAQKENITVDNDALEMIALSAEGGMRDAESLLAQAIALEDAHITGIEAAAILGVSERKTVFDFIDALGREDLDTAILVLESLAEKGIDFRSFAGALTHFLRELLFRKLGKNAQEKLASRAFSEEHDALARLAALFSFPTLARLMELIHHARMEIRHASIPQIPLQIAALAFLFPEETVSDTQHIEPTPTIRNAPAPAPIPSSLPPSPIRKIAEAPKPIVSDTEKNASPAVAEKTEQQNTNTSITKEAPKKETRAIKEDPEKNPALSLSFVQEKWSAFLAEIKHRNASLSLSLSGSTPKLSESGAVSVAVRHAFHKERLEKPENRLTIEDTLATILGVKTHLNVELAPQESDSNHALLNNALGILGGKIVS